VKILYVAMKHDYGDPARGLSFEHWNFYDSLAAAGHELVYFDFMTLYRTLGRAEMNRLLWETVGAERPSLMCTVLFEDELDPEVVRRISRETDTVTLNWFCDDHWRFDGFSARWAPCFDWVVTTAPSALPKYERIGYANVIKSQWACNDHLYRKLELPALHDVSFVGRPHGNRRAVIDALRSVGVEVYTRGYGWEEGRVSQEEMIRIFNQSRINLNLPNASTPSPHTSTKATLRSHVRSAASLVERAPFGDRLVGAARSSLRASRSAVGRAPVTSALGDDPYPEQIKGRNFEIPGCGGFLLTGPAEELDRYYEPGREIAVFSSMRELVDGVRHYLTHDDERQAIADAGYARTLAEHTYAHRFGAIFERIGLGASTRTAI